ncbi:MAG: hypothetical protein GX230_09185 [Lentisphaerae bacterium]|jgi:hypothetical protein|nr:hypothetical protein [Lentisphaerota bacterium]
MILPVNSRPTPHAAKPPHTLRLLAGLIAIIPLLLFCGCTTGSTLSPHAVVNIEITESGLALLNNESYPLNDLTHALRKLGVPRQQSLLIHIHNNHDRAKLVKISAMLRQAGYSRFIFAGEQHAESKVVNPRQTRQPPPSSPAVTTKRRR